MSENAERAVPSEALLAAEQALHEIIAERGRQDAKWGQQNHTHEWWLAILMEEVGELSQAILETHFDANPDGSPHGGLVNVKKEAVQCAAVAMALVECMNREANIPICVNTEGKKILQKKEA